MCSVDYPKVRHPAVAGQFYPKNGETLGTTVRQYIAAAKIKPAPERVESLIVPHAGYMFSGQTAGYAYARVLGKKVKRVILLGVSHFESFDTCAIYCKGVFQTPIGDFTVDESFACDLAKALGTVSTACHNSEHALEVQLPFLAESLGFVPIVPILFGAHPTKWHVDAAATIADKAADNDLVIASTDLSHRLPQAQAELVDGRTIEAIMSQNWEKVAQGVMKGVYAMCGVAAVVVAMNYALNRGADAWVLLDYRTSAAASGDFNSVVGYASISMEHKR